jgi:hypothetical protein
LLDGGKESSTISFNLSQFAGVSTTVKSFISGLLMGIVGSYVMWTLPREAGHIKAGPSAVAAK